MRVVILRDSDAVADFASRQIIDQVHRKPTSVLGLATGSSPLATYDCLGHACRRGDLSFADVTTFNLDEYLGLAPDHPQSYRYFMNHRVFSVLDIDLARTHVPDGLCKEPFRACKAYEDSIHEADGIDLQLLGIGRNGHIGFNEPSSSLGSRTRVKTLTRDTVAANRRFFEEGEFQPTMAITMGIGTILEARRIVLLATGEAKSDAVKAMVEGPLAARCPASALQWHPDTTVIIDEPAARLLEDVQYYQRSEERMQRLLFDDQTAHGMQ